MWWDILKLKPSQDYGEDPRPKDKRGEGYANTKEEGDVAIIFMPHYLYSMNQRYKGKLRHNTISPDIEARLKQLSVGDYWCYLNSNTRDRSFLMIKVMTEGKLPRAQLKVSELRTKQNERYSKVILLTHVSPDDKSSGRNYPTNAEKIDIYYKGVKPNHSSKQQPTVRPRRDEPFNPFNMGGR